MLAGMMPSRRSRLTCLPKTSRGSALSSSCVGIVPVSIRSEAANPSREDNSAGAETGGHDVDVADRQRIGRRRRHADDLTEAGREDADQGVPGNTGEVSTDEQEAAGGGDDAEQTGEDEPRRHEGERRHAAAVGMSVEPALTARQWHCIDFE